MLGVPGADRGAGFSGLGYGVSVRVGALSGGVTDPEYGFCEPGASGVLVAGAGASGVIVEVGTCAEGMVVGNSVVAQPGRFGTRGDAGVRVSTGACSVVVSGAIVVEDSGTAGATERVGEIDVAEVAVVTLTAGSPTTEDAGPDGVSTSGEELPVRAAPTA